MPPSLGFVTRPLFALVVLCIIGAAIVFSTSGHINSRSTYTPLPQLDKSTLTGHVIAPKLGNETVKAELGRSAWMLFHTTMARFPDKPTEDESLTLWTYIHLFQRLYPCGECAEHFGQLLKKYPPQVSSRSAAAAWACHVHNKVNESLKKEIFDCANIGDFYDCGCADDDGKKISASTSAFTGREKPEMSDEEKEKYVTNGRDFNTDLLHPR